MITSSQFKVRIYHNNNSSTTGIPNSIHVCIGSKTYLISQTPVLGAGFAQTTLATQYSTFVSPISATLNSILP